MCEGKTKFPKELTKNSNDLYFSVTFFEKKNVRLCKRKMERNKENSKTLHWEAWCDGTGFPFWSQGAPVKGYGFLAQRQAVHYEICAILGNDFP